MRHTKTTRQQSRTGKAITTVSGFQQQSLLSRDELKPYRKVRRPKRKEERTHGGLPE